MDNFRVLADEFGICIASNTHLQNSATEEEYDDAIKTLQKTYNAKVVVCFCEGRTVKGLLASIKRKGVQGKFILVGSDGWADRPDVVENLHEEAAGGLSVKLHSPPIKTFNQHFHALNPWTNKDNPWFKEYWQEKYKCYIIGDDYDDRWDKPCVGNETKMEQQDSKLGFVVKAVYAIARALHNMQRIVCPGVQGLCKAMQPINGTILLRHLLNVSFIAYSNETVDFDTYGDPPARYDIINYQKIFDRNGNVSYSYTTVGYWDTGKLNMRDDSIYWPDTGFSSVPESICSRPCPKGYVKTIQQGGVKCCWVCTPCKENEIMLGDDTCERCSKGMWPDDDLRELTIKRQSHPLTADSWDAAKQLPEIHYGNCGRCRIHSRAFCPRRQFKDNQRWPYCRAETKHQTSYCGMCVTIPIEYISWSDSKAIFAIVMGSFGITVTCWVLMVFIRNNNTPVVKASTRELSYIILIGIIIAFGCNFVLVMKPTIISCYFSRILPGFSMSLIYGALATKTNRIARILEGSKRIITKKLRFMSASAQVVISLILVGIECAVITAMLIVEPADSKLDYPSSKRVRLICNTSTFGVVIPFGFITILIFMCTLYAIKTRNLPENFNEAKFIGFTMYTTCVIWLGFIAIYFGSESRVVTMCVAMTLSASVALVLLFFPKTYIIIWTPEKNTRSAFTTSKDVRCHFGTNQPVNSSDGIGDGQYADGFSLTALRQRQWFQRWRQRIMGDRKPQSPVIRDVPARYKPTRQDSIHVPVTNVPAQQSFPWSVHSSENSLIQRQTSQGEETSLKRRNITKDIDCQTDLQINETYYKQFLQGRGISISPGDVNYSYLTPPGNYSLSLHKSQSGNVLADHKVNKSPDTDTPDTPDSPGEQFNDEEKGNRQERIPLLVAYIEKEMNDLIDNDDSDTSKDTHPGDPHHTRRLVTFSESVNRGKGGAMYGSRVAPQTTKTIAPVNTSTKSDRSSSKADKRKSSGAKRKNGSSDKQSLVSPSNRSISPADIPRDISLSSPPELHQLMSSPDIRVNVSPTKTGKYVPPGIPKSSSSTGMDLLEDEEMSVIEFRNYLLQHGLKLDMDSVQTCDL